MSTILELYSRGPSSPGLRRLGIHLLTEAPWGSTSHFPHCSVPAVKAGLLLDQCWIPSVSGKESGSQPDLGEEKFSFGCTPTSTGKYQGPGESPAWSQDLGDADRRVREKQKNEGKWKERNSDPSEQVDWARTRWWHMDSVLIVPQRFIQHLSSGHLGRTCECHNQSSPAHLMCAVS